MFHGNVFFGYMLNRMSQPISRVLSRAIINLGCLSPNTSSDLPKLSAGRTMEFLFGLAPSGVCHAASVTRDAVRSYRTFSPLLFCKSGLFSVALSASSHLPGVTWRFTLWSPDFPPCAKQSDCLAGSGRENSIVWIRIVVM